MQETTESKKYDLAILGGDPEFDMPLHVGQPNIGDADRLHEILAEILERRWLTNNGPVVQQFERRIEQMLGVRHCVAVCNATIGLQLLVRALELEGEVIVPSFTFCASAQALAWCGLTPVFCDVESGFHTIDPNQIESLITPNTVGVLGVHLWGNACRVSEIKRITDKHNLRLMFDAAHAFGCSHDTVKIGNFGDAEVFSFHATKYVNCFEGGVVTTNDDELAEKLRLTCNFGFKDSEVQCLGTNAKMSEISAAMGLVSLDAMPQFKAVNQHNRESYAAGLAGITEIKLVPIADQQEHNGQYVIVEIDPTTGGLTRNDLIEVLQKENVLARRYFHPGCHRIEPFQTQLPAVSERLTVTEHLCETVLALPTGTGVTTESIDRICHIVRSALAQSDEIHRVLNAPQDSSDATHRTN